MKRTICLSLLALTLMTACQASSNSPTQPGPSPSASVPAGTTVSAVVNHYATLVSANYSDALSAAQKMETAIDAFLAAPSEATLEAAKTAWLAARVPYGQTEAFRFYSGPIDSEEGPEGQLNAWPMDEVYVDAVEGAPNAGIINNPTAYPAITAELLSSLNEQGGDKNISTGYHAIEFLLWGQDLTEGPGAGQRPYTDYTTAAHADRRATYLRTVTQLLVSDLEALVAAWAPNQSNYRAEFTALPANEALGKILKGIGTLSASELASERMATPLDIGDREEEHSCFSDNTHNDIIANTQGIRNVVSGTYRRLDGSLVQGPGLEALIDTLKPELAAQLRTLGAQTLTQAAAIQAPFDQEIRPANTAGHERVLALIQTLQAQGRAIVDAGAALGIVVNTDL
jgi:putative iron-regulated protein